MEYLHIIFLLLIAAMRYFRPLKYDKYVFYTTLTIVASLIAGSLVSDYITSNHFIFVLYLANLDIMLGIVLGNLIRWRELGRENIWH